MHFINNDSDDVPIVIIDVCVTNNCGPHATCINDLGDGFICVCNQGYTGYGSVCKGE